jgi:hypothetical protein
MSDLAKRPLVNIGTPFALTHQFAQTMPTWPCHRAPKHMPQNLKTQTQTSTGYQPSAQSALIRANPRLILVNNFRHATCNTCSRRDLSRRFPPRRGGAQPVFDSTHEHHDLISNRMHPVHKTHNGIAHYARLSRSLAVVCDRVGPPQKNRRICITSLFPASHVRWPLFANTLLSLLAPPVTNSPFRDCSRHVAEPRRTPMRTV